MSSSMCFIAKIKNCRDLSVVLDFCPLFSWLFSTRSEGMQAIQQDWGLVQSFWISEKNPREFLILPGSGAAPCRAATARHEWESHRQRAGDGYAWRNWKTLKCLKKKQRVFGNRIVELLLLLLLLLLVLVLLLLVLLLLLLLLLMLLVSLLLRGTRHQVPSAGNTWKNISLCTWLEEDERWRDHIRMRCPLTDPWHFGRASSYPWPRSAKSCPWWWGSDRQHAKFQNIPATLPRSCACEMSWHVLKRRWRASRMSSNNGSALTDKIWGLFGADPNVSQSPERAKSWMLKQKIFPRLKRRWCC